MTWTEFHPALNAGLNFTSLLCLVAGYRAIRRKDRVTHRKFMLGAASVSVVFLISYLTRFALSGAHRYPGDGWDKGLYLAILGSHSLLAAVCLPLVGRTLWLGLKNRVDKHRRIARVTFPIWVYVSVTGVIVYVMLYHLGERL